MKKVSFQELELSPEILSAVTEMGFENPSPIQAQTIPALMSGKDVVGQAQTGTGKTAAFGIPLIESIDVTKSRKTVGLILCPTRELCLQVANEIVKLSKFKKGVEVVAIYGGDPIQNQIRSLRAGVQIVVGTPGRVIDHINRGTLNLEHIEMAILDEADEMLNMGFREDIEQILTHTPSTRQTVLFSATMPKTIMDIIHKFQNEPEIIKIVRAELTNTDIEQIYFDIERGMKTKAMINVLQFNNFSTVIVFCNTKRMVDELVETLMDMRYKAEAIHGDLGQSQRNKVMAAFRNGESKILVATDVAARGLDISNVDAVFNYDLPHDYEYYVHRIGRTGRAGKLGKAYSFVTGRNDAAAIRNIEAFTKARIVKQHVPTAQEVTASKKQLFVQNILDAISQETTGNEKVVALMDELNKDGLNHETLALALLKMVMPAEMQHTAPAYDDINFRGSHSAGTSGSRNGGRDFGGRSGGGRFDRDRNAGGNGRSNDRPYPRTDRPYSDRPAGGARFERTDRPNERAGRKDISERSYRNSTTVKDRPATDRPASDRRDKPFKKNY